MVRLALRLTAIVVVFLVQSGAFAAVIERDWLVPGDGLLTFDDVNNREWLDLIETQLFKFPGNTLEEKYQAVVDETLPGGMFEEFSVTGEEDVTAFAESAGVVGVTFGIQVNPRSKTALLIDLIGDTEFSDSMTRNRISRGLVPSSSDMPFSVSIVFAPEGLGTRPGPPLSGITDSPSIGNGRTGVWLYRNIPEPSTQLVLTIGLACSAMARLRSR